MKRLRSMALFLICILAGILCGCGNKNSADEYRFKLGKNYVNGTYQGDFLGKKPDGEGVFTAKNSQRGIRKISGTWKQGLPDGETRIDFEDGSFLKCITSGGVLEGDAELVKKDRTYSKMHFSDGKLYRDFQTFDQKGNLISKDYVYNGQLVGEIKKKVSDIDYAEMLADPKAFHGSRIRIEGKVEKIYETDNRIYFEIKDADDLPYMVYSNNTEVSRYRQAIVPNNIKVNDQIVVYGEFNGCNNKIEYVEEEQNVVKEYLRSTMPFIVNIKVETESEINAEDPDYNTIKENSYYFTGREVKKQGKILSVNIDYDKKRTVYEISGKEKYFLARRYKQKKEILLPGTSVEFEGYLNGNFKVSDQEGHYEKYPLVWITSIESKKGE